MSESAAIPEELLVGIDEAARLLPTLDAAVLLQTGYREPDFLVDHLILKKAVTLISGDTGSGKTALLMHCAAAIAFGERVARRFPTEPNSGRVLFMNGEMSTDILRQYLHQAIATFQRALPIDRIVLEGADGIATFRFDDYEARENLERLISAIKPSLVIFDTLRALFNVDENDASEIRRVFSWIRSLCTQYGCAVCVAHHLRKISSVSNKDRERVSGSRDIIASVDVHVHLRSQNGRPLHALAIDKTRGACRSVSAGTEWPIEARLEPGAPPQSILIAGDANTPNISAVEAKEEEILARLNSEGLLTRAELAADGGSSKRALEGLLKAGTVCQVGKEGRRMRYGLNRPELTSRS